MKQEQPKLIKKYSKNELITCISRLLKISQEYEKNKNIPLSNIAGRVSMEAGITEDCLDFLALSGLYEKVRDKTYAVPDF